MPEHPTADQSPPAAESAPAGRLRREVGLLRRRETRRVFAAAVHVGVLDGEHESAVVAARDRPLFDAGLRTDVVSALLERTEASATEAWLVRPGWPEPHDDDLAWLAAVRSAFAMHGRVLTGFYAVTRYGWRDVATGEGRTWRRLRL